MVATRTDRRQGKVKGQPQKYLLGHNRRLSPDDYIVDPETGCWIWQRSLLNGYGVLRRGGRTQLAHRWYYEQKHGMLPAGEPLDHLCSVTRCVNPDHLELVTTKVNCHRSTATKLSDADVEVARAAIAGGAGLRATARALGVTHGSLHQRLYPKPPRKRAAQDRTGYSHPMRPA